MEMNQNYQMISRCANLNGDRVVDTIQLVGGMDLPKSHLQPLDLFGDGHHGSCLHYGLNNAETLPVHL